MNYGILLLSLASIHILQSALLRQGYEGHAQLQQHSPVSIASPLSPQNAVALLEPSVARTLDAASLKEQKAFADIQQAYDSDNLLPQEEYTAQSTQAKTGFLMSASAAIFSSLGIAYIKKQKFADPFLILGGLNAVKYVGGTIAALCILWYVKNQISSLIHSPCKAKKDLLKAKYKLLLETRMNDLKGDIKAKLKAQAETMDQRTIQLHAEHKRLQAELAQKLEQIQKIDAHQEQRLQHIEQHVQVAADQSQKQIKELNDGLEHVDIARTSGDLVKLQLKEAMQELNQLQEKLKASGDQQAERSNLQLIGRLAAQFAKLDKLTDEHEKRMKAFEHESARMQVQSSTFKGTLTNLLQAVNRIQVQIQALHGPVVVAAAEAKKQNI